MLNNLKTTNNHMTNQEFKKHEIDYILYNMEANFKSISDELFNKEINYIDAMEEIRDLSKHLIRMIKNVESIK
jgi:hypothetical protein